MAHRWFIEGSSRTSTHCGMASSDRGGIFDAFLAPSLSGFAWKCHAARGQNENREAKVSDFSGRTARDNYRNDGNSRRFHGGNEKIRETNETSRLCSACGDVFESHENFPCIVDASGSAKPLLLPRPASRADVFDWTRARFQPSLPSPLGGSFFSLAPHRLRFIA